MNRVEIVFERIKSNDIMLLTEIMKRAFDEDSKRHLGKPNGGPPGYDDGTFLQKYAIDSPTQSFKILYDSKPIGAVILWINDDGNNYLGNIFVDPLVQDKGIGTQIWQKVETMYPQTRKWLTETPGFSKRNHHFYINKCGFKLIRIEHINDVNEESYILEKVLTD